LIFNVDPVLDKLETKLKSRGAHSSVSLSGRRSPDRADDAPTTAASAVCRPQFHRHAAAFHAHVRRPRARLFDLRAQRRRIPFSVLLFVLPIALPCPPRTATWTGHFDLPLRLPSPQRAPPMLIAAPRPLSRHPPLLLRPAAGGVPPPARATEDGPYLVSSSIYRFSLRFTVATTPFDPPPPPHPSSFHRSTGMSSELPPRLCFARPDTLHR
jgi:hypothetical protein